MMLPIEGATISADIFGVIKPERVLLEYDGPRFFTCRLNCGIESLAFFCEENEFTRYLVVPTTDAIVDGLEAGSLSLRDALTRTVSQPWVIDVDMASAETRQAWSVARAQVPDQFLPRPHVMLRRDLQPI